MDLLTSWNDFWIGMAIAFGFAALVLLLEWFYKQMVGEHE